MKNPSSISQQTKSYLKDDLSQDQLNVVKSSTPKLVVNAVAGAGKTRTLCECIRHCTQKNVDPSSILVLCFGTRTAKELKTRVPENVTVSTFHAFANKLIKTAGNNSKVPNRGQMQSALDRVIKKNPKLCRRISRSIDLKQDNNVAALLQFYNATHGDNELEERTIEDGYSSFGELTEVLPEVRKLYCLFLTQLRKKKFVGFADMLTLARIALANRNLKYSHIFVDEYQDMDMGQARLLIAIANQAKFLRVFGDPNQAIFSFIGTQFNNIAEMLGAKTKKLSIAHRLTHPTAATATAILRDSHFQVVIEGARKGKKPSLIYCNNQHQQENEILSLVKRLVADGTPASEIAILTRTRRQLRLLERLLRSEGFMVNATYRPKHLDHLYQLLDIGRYTMKHQQALRENSISNKNKKKIEEIICDITKTKLDEPRRKKARRSLINASAASSFEGMFSAVKRLYVAAIKTRESMWKEVRNELNIWEPITRRFRSIDKFQSFSSRSYKKTGIVLSTIHSAKGMEWDHVILPDMTDGVLPHFREIKRDNVEEERRLFYVAVTRAKIQAHLLSTPIVWNGTTRSKRSRFLTSAVLQTLKKIPASDNS